VKVPMTEENMMKCICGDCPTFKQSDMRDGTYCSMGKSEQKPEMAGCDCLSCAVYAEYELEGAYFCIHGAAV